MNGDDTLSRVALSHSAVKRWHERVSELAREARCRATNERKTNIMNNTKFYNNAMKIAEQKAASSTDGELKYDGESYKLEFDRTHWHYKVTDEDGELIINLNVKGLSKAKSELKKWLSS